MYKLSKFIITVIAIVSILCCVPVASAVDATEPTEATSEQASEHPVEQEEDDHNAICCILLAIGIPSGCLIAQGFSFWKW